MSGKSLYRPDYASQAEKLCVLGATDHQLAEFFGVSDTTVDNWKVKYPAFATALTAGKQVADTAVVQSLFRRATGYEHRAVKIFCDKDGHITEAPYVERYAPDTTACIFWLKNRRPDEWRDRKEMDLSSKGMSLAQLLALGASADASDKG